MYSKKDSFSLVEVSFEGDSYLKEFIKVYEKDIRKFYPNFNKDELKNYNCYFVLRNLNPAGLFACEKLENAKIKIHIDYAIPDYRDLKNAMYLYSTEVNFLKQNKVSAFVAETDIDEHQRYLVNVGFKRENSSSTFIKTV